MAISTFIWSVFFTGIHDYSLFYKLELIEAISTLLLLAILYYFFQTMTNERPLRGRDYLWLLPTLIIGTSMILLYLLMGDQQATIYVREITENKGTLVTLTDPVSRMQQFIGVRIYMPLVFLQIIYVLVYASVRLVQYRKRLNEFFSNPEGRSLRNAKAVLVGVYFVLLLSLCSYKGRFHYNDSELFTDILMILWAILAYYMGYNVYNLTYTADNLVNDLAAFDNRRLLKGHPQTKEGSIIVNTKDLIEVKKKQQELLDRFNLWLDKEKLFLRPDLRITDVALQMNTNRTYLSRMINEECGCSFSDFINYKRIEYAQEKALSNPYISQEQLAESSGFLYSSSFSRTFKQQTGITFREWQKQISKKM